MLIRINAYQHLSTVRWNLEVLASEPPHHPVGGLKGEYAGGDYRTGDDFAQELIHAVSEALDYVAWQQRRRGLRPPSA